MTAKSPKTALKIILGALFILSFAIVSCNNEKKDETKSTETVAPAPSTTDTTKIDTTGTTKPVKELN